MLRSAIRILTVLAVGALGACGDSTGVDTDLTEEEAAALAEAVLQSAFFTLEGSVGGPFPVNGPAPAPFSYNESVSFTADCPVDGVVHVDGSIDAQGDDETGEGRIELAVDHDHQGCVVESDNGTVFTFDGSPDLSFDMVIESDGQGTLAWEGAIEGGLDWATDERVGRCSIDFAFEGLIEIGASISISLEGSVCRRAVEHSIEVTLDS